MDAKQAAVVRKVEEIKEKMKKERKPDRLDRQLARYVYEAPFAGFPTYFDAMSFVSVVEDLRVRLLYHGEMRDAHHESDRAIVQTHLEDLVSSDVTGIFVMCVTYEQLGLIEVFAFCRILYDVEPIVSIVAATKENEMADPIYIGFMRDKRQSDISVLTEESFLELHELLDDKKQFPRCTFIGTVVEMRQDYEQVLSKIVNYNGVVVGYIAEETGDRVLREDVVELQAYVRSLTGDSEFGYFTMFEDHGCHGTSYFVIVVPLKK